jgi:dTDP-glucose pyrophosphorylase
MEQAALARFCVTQQDSFRKLLERLDFVPMVFVLDEHGRVWASCDERAARRAILEGKALDDAIGCSVGDRSFAYIRSGESRVNAVELMESRGVPLVAVIDECGVLVGVQLKSNVVGPVRTDLRAVIMAGGRGSRLYPLTEKIPKPMLLVAGRPIIERLVLHLAGFGIQDIYLAINYLGSMIEEHFGDGRRFGCQIHYLREKQPMGTGGSLSLLERRVDQRTLVLNGDLVTQINITSMLATHEQTGAVATMGVRRYQVQVPFGVVETERSLIRAFREKPSVEYLVNAGVYVFNQEALDMVPAGQEFPITVLFEDCLARDKPVAAHLIEEEWIDVGQLDSLLRARGGQ